MFKIRLKLHTAIADKQAIGQIPTSSINFQLIIINKERTEKYTLYMIDMQQNNNNKKTLVKFICILLILCVPMLS